MAGSDSGNKPAKRIGLAIVVAAIIALILLAIFANRVAAPDSAGPAGQAHGSR